MKALQALEKLLKEDIYEADYQYARYDMYSERYIIEYKARRKMYDELLIEFNKYSFNKMYADVNKINFIYACSFGNLLYVCNISKLPNDFNFNWEWKGMPKQTDFADNKFMPKFVGYIPINVMTKIEL
jgi:hypothetical protein